jgi:hypothetical protein
MGPSVTYAQFEWETGVTPFSSPAAPVTGVLLYLFVVFGLRTALGGKAVGVHRSLVALHNLVLFAASGIMFVGCAYEAVLVRRAPSPTAPLAL